MFLHLMITSSAMYTANRAPLDLTWITLQVMADHVSENVFIIFKHHVITFVTHDTIISLAFER